MRGDREQGHREMPLHEVLLPEAREFQDAHGHGAPEASDVTALAQEQVSRFFCSGAYELRFLSLRKKHTTALCLNPKAKPRHEVIDVKHYSERRKKSYLDFFEAGSAFTCLFQLTGFRLHTAQEGEWMSVEDYFDENADETIKRKIKTHAAKRNWIVKAPCLGL